MKKKAKGKIRFRIFFLIWFAICILAGCAWIGHFYKEGWQECRTASPRDTLAQKEIESVEYRLKQTDEQGDSVPVRLAGLRMSPDDYEESAWVLYQPETGEFYTDQPCYAAYVWQNGESKQYYLYDTETISRLYDSVHFLYGGEPLLYSIYVKDDQFVPGELFVVKDSYLPFPRYQTEGRKIAGEWIDLTPDNTDGWTKICSDRSKEYLASYHDVYVSESHLEESAKKTSMDGNSYLSGAGLIGCANAPEADAFRQKIRSELADEYARIRENQKQRYKDAENGSVSAETLDEYHVADRKELLEFYQRSDKAQRRDLPKQMYKKFQYDTTGRSWNFSFEDADVHFRGEDWMLYHFQYINPQKMFYRLFLVFLPLMIPPLLVFSLLIGLLLAVITYSVYSRRYDIEAYRRSLTGALAHDLKTPLSVIYGNAENLRAHVHPENADEYADCIMENVTHIDEMIAGVLGLAQLERRTAPPMKDNADLAALLHTAFQRKTAAMKQRCLTLEESGNLPLRGNADMLTQLAENLAANAVQHASEGGKITVSAEKNTLRISNPYTGELDVKALCEPFKRGDAARGSQSGSGLGLSIVQQIAALHHLRLTITAKDGIFTAELKKTMLPILKRK